MNRRHKNGWKVSSISWRCCSIMNHTSSKSTINLLSYVKNDFWKPHVLWVMWLLQINSTKIENGLNIIDFSKLSKRGDISLKSSINSLLHARYDFSTSLPVLWVMKLLHIKWFECRAQPKNHNFMNYTPSKSSINLLLHVKNSFLKLFPFIKL